MIKHWICEECEWEWPLGTPPPEGAECDNCGGELISAPCAATRTYGAVGCS